MKFKIKKNILAEALNNVSKALSSKNIIPILSGIKFTITKDKLELTASDNDITIQTYIEKSKDLEIEKVGSIVIKGKYILDIVRKVDDEFINIEKLEDSKVLIYTKNSEFNLNGISVSEYPPVDLELTKDFITLNVNKFKEIINQTNYATSTDEGRVVLTGLNMKTENQILECSATDSYRLAIKKIKLEEQISKDINIIIPSKNLNELYKLLDQYLDENIELHIFTNKIIFKFGKIIFQSRLINGTYPNTGNLIPEEILFDLKVNKREFYNMVDRASILNNDRDSNIITLEVNNNMLKITSMSLEIGKVEEKMEVLCLENIKISFSSRYMMETLRTITTEDVILDFVGDIKPILLKETDNEDFIGLILPIRTY